jgi:hypothetical protein
MGKIRNPIQFSEHFGISETLLDKLGVLDPTLNVDVKLFVDPLLLEGSKHAEIRKSAKSFRNYFVEIIKLLVASKREGDVAWREAQRRLQFSEVPGTCLGYSAASIRGSAFGPQLSYRVLSTAKEIVDMGVVDPDLFVALPLLEEGVGPDLISDMTTNIILADLIEFNTRVLKSLDVPTKLFQFGAHSIQLPLNPTAARPTPIILLPKDVLRELPIAQDWDSVCEAARKNALLRATTNRLIGAIWKAKNRRQKGEIRKTVLASKDAFDALMQSIHEAKKTSYDFEKDPQGLLKWRDLLASAAREEPLILMLAADSSIDDVYDIVLKIVNQFCFLVEEKGLWKELWEGVKRRPEKSAQRIFFAVAYSYCEANNIDVSPEMDTGTGVVDFKFSAGAKARVMVEIKLSDNSKVVAGYEKQLEAYKKSEKTSKGVYVVINVGGMGNKDKDLLKVKNEQAARGEPTSEIVFVDGSKRRSASKL